MVGQSAIKISNLCKLWKCHVHDKGSTLDRGVARIFNLGGPNYMLVH